MLQFNVLLVILLASQGIFLASLPGTMGFGMSLRDDATSFSWAERYAMAVP